MSLPQSSVLFADDARLEATGKFSLIGIYGEDMVFPGSQLPNIIPRIALVVSIRWPDFASVEPVTIEIYGPAQKDETPADVLEPAIPELWKEQSEPGSRPGLILVHGMELVPLSGAGEFRIFIRTSTSREMVGRLKVRASQPPAEAAEEVHQPPKPKKRQRRPADASKG